jgi:hypothetical protein
MLPMWRYFACFPKLSRKLFKVLVKLWSTPDSTLSVLSFLLIRRLVSASPNIMVEAAFKVGL